MQTKCSNRHRRKQIFFFDYILLHTHSGNRIIVRHLTAAKPKCKQPSLPITIQLLCYSYSFWSVFLFLFFILSLSFFVFQYLSWNLIVNTCFFSTHRSKIYSFWIRCCEHYWTILRQVVFLFLLLLFPFSVQIYSILFAVVPFFEFVFFQIHKLDLMRLVWYQSWNYRYSQLCTDYNDIIMQLK